MDRMIERLTSLPKMIGGFVATATGASVTHVVEPAHASILPDSLVGWATVGAGFGTLGLCVLRGVVEYRKAKKEKVFE